MDLLRSNKIFHNDINFIFPMKQNIVIKQKFVKASSKKAVTLYFTDDDILILVNTTGGKKIRKIDWGLRFTVKEEKKINPDQYIYKLTFECDDKQTIELLSNDQNTLIWMDVLHKKMSLLDFQAFYEQEKNIGQGSFASVYIIKRKSDGLHFAAKAFFKKMLFANDAKGRLQIENEVNMMRKLNHPNLVNLIDVYENPGQVFLVLDLARGGTLEQGLKQLNGPVPYLAAKVIFKQILEGVYHMHSQGIMHRDLKPSNILFRQAIPLKCYGLQSVGNNVLISDFGISSDIKETLNVYQYCGSPGYMAPEVYKCENDPSKTYDEKVDIFSLGAILYQMLIGKMLFQGVTAQEVKKLNQISNIDFVQLQKDLNMSTTLTLLMKRMLSKIPVERPSVKELLESKILQVETGEDGVPIFKDYQRPRSSPPKRQTQILNIDHHKTLTLVAIKEESKSTKNFKNDLDKKQNEMKPNNSQLVQKRMSGSEKLQPSSIQIHQTQQNQLNVQQQSTRIRNEQSKSVVLQTPKDKKN